MEHPDAVPDIEKIRRLASLMERRGLSRLVLTEDGVTVRLESGPQARHGIAMPAEMLATMVPALAGVAEAGPDPEPETPTEEALAGPVGTPLLSPTTGTFYRAPAPGEPPFVDVGDFVAVGQTVGIIMAMKVMSEVPAEVAGEVTAIPAQDGELVQSGTPLVVVNPQ